MCRQNEIMNLANKNKNLHIYFFISFLFRLFLICIGEVIDSLQLELKYTDIDYRIYSDGTRNIFEGISPFERPTFRYPPILPILLFGNIYLHPVFGKLVFSLFDSLIIYKIDSCRRNLFNQQPPSSKYDLTTTTMVILWALNPISAYLCSRGSADSIANYFILLSIDLFLSKSYFIFAITYSFTIYFRLYPIIYFPSFLGSYLFQQKNYPLQKTILQIGYYFSLGIVSFLTFFISSYYFYGSHFLQESILYHLFRIDHRHNFSIYFYLTYLTKSLSLNNIFFSLLPMCNQFVLIITLASKYSNKNLSLCILIQTMIFVFYNKVLTGQYFSWILILLPLSIDHLSPIIRSKFVLISIILINIFLWVYFAYAIEFEGLNSFFMLWICSLMFFILNNIFIFHLIS